MKITNLTIQLEDSVHQQVDNILSDCNISKNDAVINFFECIAKYEKLPEQVIKLIEQSKQKDVTLGDDEEEVADIFKIDESSKQIEKNNCNALNIDYGEVERYISERGFGFVSSKFYKNTKSIFKELEVFFHIKTIKKTDSNLARKLQNEEENIFFWYEMENTNKGKQVFKVINVDEITEQQLSSLSMKLKEKWLDISKEFPSWLKQASIDILNAEEITKLQKKRELLINEMEEKKQLEKLERERLQKEREEKHQKEMEEKKQFNEIREKEFRQLVDEMQQFSFRHSSDVSKYIVKNKLGYKYKTISGELEMHQNGESWKFKGGFPPDIYARLCYELGLLNNGSNAKAGKFESFQSLNDW